MPAGRPTKYTPEIAERILSFIRLGHAPSSASKACGISPRTFRSWIQKGRDEPDTFPELAEFLPRFLEAEGMALTEFERTTIADAKQSGELSLKVLERRAWRDWGQQGWRIRQQEREIQELKAQVEELKALIIGGRAGVEA